METSAKYQINKKYGKTFKGLRKKQKVSLSHFSKIGISKSALAQFERGETMMKFDRLHRCLEELNISLAEFELIINDFSLNYQDELLIEIEKADLLENKNMLKNIEQISKNDYYYISLAAKARYTDLSYKESNLIFNFLFDLSTWTYFELTLLYLVCDKLPQKLQKVLIMNAFEYDVFSQDNPMYRDRLLQIIYRSTLSLCKDKDKEMVEYIICKTKPLLVEHTLLLNNLRHFSIGCYNFTFFNKHEGKKLMMESINIFNLLNSPAIAQYYKNIYNLFLEQNP